MVELVETPIPGLVVVHLDLHQDERGWFKENWNHETMAALGLPDLGPVQHNLSHSVRRGTTRGIHCEPWDKLVSVANGSVFGAWVDLREGASYGAVHTAVIDPAVAVFVPRGVGNAFQTLEDGVTYSMLVNGHHRPGQAYPSLDPGDPSLGIAWPIPLDGGVSDAG